jgi:hypothetical protein
VIGMGVCVTVREAIMRSAIDAKVHTQGCGLGEKVADLRFELGVKSSAAEAELVLVVLRLFNSGSCQEPGSVSIGEKRDKIIRAGTSDDIYTQGD